uniref:Protein kinase domain-containing protein n=1 Tax=Panagrellus redivivus TaxID=6233 RepID=A0A7E4UQW0_PANRE
MQMSKPPFNPSGNQPTFTLPSVRYSRSAWGQRATLMPMFDTTANRLMKAVKAGVSSESWIGGSFLFDCHSMMYEPDELRSPDYTFETCQFSENSREYYKAHQLDIETLQLADLIANFDRSTPLTVAFVPLTMEHFNAITREAAVLKTLKHDNIAQYTNITFKRGFMLLEMPFTIRLSDLLEGAKQERFEKYHDINSAAGDAEQDEFIQFGIPEAPAAKITRAILDGLEYVHCRGVWHSRLSTDCILLGMHDGRIAISGWMYLKPTKCRIQKAPVLSRFMAPEQAARTLEGRRYTACLMQTFEKQLSEAIDIWSLGIIICEMILGISVYGDVSADEMAMLIFELDFPNLQSCSPFKISKTLDEIAASCLHRNPSNRDTASKILKKYEKYFLKYADTKDVIEESIDNPNHITNLASTHDTYSTFTTRHDKLLKFSFDKDIEHDLEKLKWKRYREKRVHRNRGLSLNTGGNHICIRIRDEMSLFPSVSPFKYVDILVHPDNSGSIYLLQEAVMSLTKDGQLTNVQAFKICTLIAQLTQLALAIDEKTDDVFVQEVCWTESYSILRILVPLKDVSAAVIQQDWCSMYYSVLIEYTYSPV